jgi:hypothetical protein
MSTSDGFAFAQHRPYSSLDRSRQIADGIYDFIAFLGVAQKLRVELLPITWQATREDIGSGATSQINQAFVSEGTSFAFKRIADKRKWEEAFFRYR